MGHSRDSGHVGRSGATAEKKNGPKRRCLGAAPGPQRLRGVLPSPAQTHQCCPHRSCRSHHRRGQDTLCRVRVTMRLCLPGKPPGAPHTSQARSHLSSHFPVCLGQCPNARGSQRPPLSTPSPDVKLARRCAGWIQGSGRHPLEGAPNFTSLGLGYIG